MADGGGRIAAASSGSRHSTGDNSLRSGCTCSGIKWQEAVGTQVSDGETKLEVAPHEIATVQTKLPEFGKVEKGTYVRMLGGLQKRPEINDVLETVIEVKAEAVAAKMVRMGDAEAVGIHARRRVMFAEETDLCSTK
jgi:hypothetical protein